MRALYAEPNAISHDVIEFRDGRIFERDSRPQLVEGAAVGRVWSFRDVTAERRATRRATFLAAASKILAGTLEDVTPLDVIARMTVPWLCDWCNILLIDDDGQVRSAAAHHHDPSKIAARSPAARRTSAAHRSVSRVIDTGEPVVDNDISDEQLCGPLDNALASVDTRGAAWPSCAASRMRARMIVPLRARGQIIGAIVFCSSDPERRYDKDDLALATDLAQRAALAIDNQRLYQAAKDAVALRDEFLSVASHELRTPVTSLQLAVQSALAIGPRRWRAAWLSAARARVGRAADAAARRGSSTRCSTCRAFRRGGSSCSASRSISAAVVREVVVAARRRRAPRRLRGAASTATCRSSATGTARASTRWSRTCCRTPSSTAPARPSRISVRKLERARAAATCATRASASLRRSAARIFERFERAVSAKHYGGLGLGLYIVRRIVDAHGGSIAVESAPGAGAAIRRRAAALVARFERKQAARASGWSAAAARGSAARPSETRRDDDAARRIGDEAIVDKHEPVARRRARDGDAGFVLARRRACRSSPGSPSPRSATHRRQRARQGRRVVGRRGRVVGARIHEAEIDVQPIVEKAASEARTR